MSEQDELDDKAARNLEILMDGDPIVGEVRLGRSPVSDIIENVWRAQDKPPRRKQKRPVRRKGQQQQQQRLVSLSGSPPASESLRVDLTGEQLIAVFDGLKLLLARLAAADPQPLQAIYTVTETIKRLEPVVTQQARAFVERQQRARPGPDADGQ